MGSTFVATKSLNKGVIRYHMSKIVLSARVLADNKTYFTKGVKTMGSTFVVTKSLNKGVPPWSLRVRVQQILQVKNPSYTAQQCVQFKLVCCPVSLIP